MEEKQLLKIAIFTSLIGLFILLIILERIDFSESNINAINKTMLDKQIKIKGEITNIRETPGLYIINVKDNTASINVIVFKEDKLELKRGDIIQVEGTVTLYKDAVELIAKKITIL